MLTSSFFCATALTALYLSTANAIAVDFSDQASITAAAKTLVDGVLSYYNGSIPGLFPNSYYWWESGAAWNTLIDYWVITGDASYNALVEESLLFQRGPHDDYMVVNQTASEGNDDQATWALAAMTAAEANLPIPSSTNTTWLQLAEDVFNDQVARWDTSTCNGGIRWQIYPFNGGYDYKNSITQGFFFQLAARLAAHTGNQTYADWAERAWAWSVDVGLVSSTYAVYDGTTSSENCTSISHLQWTVDAGAFLYGSAVMHNITRQNNWADRTTGLLDATSIFFTNTSIMYEATCEPNGNCDTDQRVFKAFLARWMGATAAIAPFTTDYIRPKMLASARAAATACSGGVNGTACGEKWSTGGYDGNTGLGEELSALEVFLAVLQDMGDSAGTPSVSSTVAGAGAGSSTVATVMATSSTQPSVALASSTTVAVLTISHSIPLLSASATTTPIITATQTATTTATTTAALAAYTGGAAKLSYAKEACSIGAAFALLCFL